MSAAQVTEAHRELARRIMFEFTQAGTATASDVRMAAQIIADSEAKATAQLRADRDYNHECINRLASATGTLGEKSGRVVEVALSTIARAQRAEAKLNESRYETVKAAQEGLRECIRAERAEAELAKAKAILASIEEDGTEEHNAAVRLRQELAAERARLDSGQILLTVASERIWHCGVDLRAAIDAAMKEETK